MSQSNNTQKTLKPKNQKKYTEAVNLGKKLSKTPDITKVSVATQMFELIHDEDREIISKAFMEGANLTEIGSMTWRSDKKVKQALKYIL